MKPFDLGVASKEAPVKALTETERKLAAFAMAINLTLVKLVLEGAIEAQEQAHFMIHFQDYASRLFLGEDVDMDGQTFKVNSKLGGMFYDAAEDGLLNGKKYTEELTAEAARRREEQQKLGENVNPDLASTRILN